jgi:hypothetical protein
MLEIEEPQRKKKRERNAHGDTIESMTEELFGDFLIGENAVV